MKLTSILSSVLFGLAVIAAPAFAGDEHAAAKKDEAKAEKLNTVCACGKEADGKTVVEVGDKKVKVAVCCKECADVVAKAPAEDVIKAAKENKGLAKADEKKAEAAK
jgi:hypothetical protein